MSKQNDNIGSPPAYPPPIHHDAGPANPGSPYNAYGGLNHGPYNGPPSQAHLDPRGPGGYGSPAPGGYHSPMPGGQYGPPMPQQSYYGPPGPQQGMYYGQQGPPPGQYGGGPYYNGPYGGQRPYSQYERDRGASSGICAGLAGALACCCCLDLLF